MTGEETCSTCKHLGVIISQMADYFCYSKNEYLGLDDLSFVCDDYVFDPVSLSDKEDKVW